MHKSRRKSISKSSAHSQKNEIEKRWLITLNKCIHKDTYNCSGFYIKHYTETLQLTKVIFTIHMFSIVHLFFFSHFVMPRTLKKRVRPVRPCVRLSVRSKKFKARVLKFHIWILRQKIAYTYFFSCPNYLPLPSYAPFRCKSGIL